MSELSQRLNSSFQVKEGKSNSSKWASVLKHQQCSAASVCSRFAALLSLSIRVNLPPNRIKWSTQTRREDRGLGTLSGCCSALHLKELKNASTFHCNPRCLSPDYAVVVAAVVVVLHLISPNNKSQVEWTALKENAREREQANRWWWDTG